MTSGTLNARAFSDISDLGKTSHLELVALGLGRPVWMLLQCQKDSKTFKDSKTDLLPVHTAGGGPSHHPFLKRNEVEAMRAAFVGLRLWMSVTVKLRLLERGDTPKLGPQ